MIYFRSPTKQKRRSINQDWDIVPLPSMPLFYSFPSQIYQTLIPCTSIHWLGSSISLLTLLQTGRGKFWFFYITVFYMQSVCVICAKILIVTSLIYLFIYFVFQWLNAVKTLECALLLSCMYWIELDWIG